MNDLFIFLNRGEEVLNLKPGKIITKLQNSE